MRACLFPFLALVIVAPPRSVTAQRWGGGGVGTQAPVLPHQPRGVPVPMSGGVVVSPFFVVPAPSVAQQPSTAYGWGGSWDGHVARVGGSPPVVRQPARATVFFVTPVAVQPVPARAVPADSVRLIDRREFYRRRFGRP